MTFPWSYDKILIVKSIFKKRFYIQKTSEDIKMFKDSGKKKAITFSYDDGVTQEPIFSMEQTVRFWGNW